MARVDHDPAAKWITLRPPLKSATVARLSDHDRNIIEPPWTRHDSRGPP